MARKSLKDKARAVNRVLTRVYGRKAIEYDEDPVDTLVETILSQNTTDRNSHRSFVALKKAYPSWDMMLKEDPRKIADIIHSGGLADLKAERILGALGHIMRERGRLDLNFLRKLTPDGAEAWLARIRGVGPKTRGIVLLFALRMPAFPVDTHIHRVTKRIGLIGPKVSRERAQEELAKLVEAKEYYNFHINIIEHGRAVCQARQPKCSECKVSRYCDYYRNVARAR